MYHLFPIDAVAPKPFIGAVPPQGGAEGVVFPAQIASAVSAGVLFVKAQSGERG